jgi:hypothetical protein
MKLTTVIDKVADFPSDAAVSVAVPSDWPVTTPAEFAVARAISELLQDTVFPISSLPVSSSAVTPTLSVCPFAILARV